MSVNKVIMVGRLGSDPELRNTQGGTASATWRMATNRKYKDRDGNFVEATQWHNVKVWGAQAENCEKYLSKGREVYVEGRLEHFQYEKDGATKYWTEVVADTVRFLGGAGNGTHASTDEASPPPQYADADIPF